MIRHKFHVISNLILKKYNHIITNKLDLSGLIYCFLNSRCFLILLRNYIPASVVVPV